MVFTYPIQEIVLYFIFIDDPFVHQELIQRADRTSQKLLLFEVSYFCLEFLDLHQRLQTKTAF